MQPRLIRLRDAAKYLGMDRNRFNNEVRPFLVTLKIGQQGIAFDRFDLDKWADEFKQSQSKPPQRLMRWQPLEDQTLLREKKRSLVRKKIGDNAFEQLVDQLCKQKSDSNVRLKS